MFFHFHTLVPPTFSNHQQCFWRVLHWNLLFTSWGWVCVIFLNNAETQAACSTAFKFISYFFFMSSLLHPSRVQLYIYQWNVSDFTETIGKTQSEAWISISKSVWMLVGVHNVHLCCLPVSTHFVSFTHPHVNSLLFVTNVTNLQTLSM